MASQNGHVLIVDELISKGADVNYMSFNVSICTTCCITIHVFNLIFIINANRHPKYFTIIKKNFAQFSNVS